MTYQTAFALAAAIPNGGGANERMSRIRCPHLLTQCHTAEATCLVKSQTFANTELLEWSPMLLTKSCRTIASAVGPSERDAVWTAAPPTPLIAEDRAVSVAVIPMLSSSTWGNSWSKKR